MTENLTITPPLPPETGPLESALRWSVSLFLVFGMLARQPGLAVPAVRIATLAALLVALLLFTFTTFRRPTLGTVVAGNLFVWLVLRLGRDPAWWAFGLAEAAPPATIYMTFFFGPPGTELSTGSFFYLVFSLACLFCFNPEFTSEATKKTWDV